MEETQLEQLLRDIVNANGIEPDQREFALSLAEAERYDRLIVRLTALTQQPRFLLELATYPATPDAIRVTPQADTQSLTVAELFSAELATYSDPLSLQEILDLLTDAQFDAYDHVRERPVERVTLTNAVFDALKADNAQHEPNEYAFLATGSLLDGVAHFDHYYAGEMDVSTPFYCELSEAFVNRVLYETMPANHLMVAWGHVHPIEMPSDTDTTTFLQLAVADQAMAELGKFIRSVALIVSSGSGTLRAYDVVSQEELPVDVI